VTLFLLFSGCGKAGEQMYLFLGQEEVEGGALSSLHTDLLAALQNIKQLQPPLTTLEGKKTRNVPILSSF
jgi:hypothetical protein